jgi:Ca2+-binding EF-hand superfamily protein
MGNGKEAEADEIYKIFDRKDKNSVALNEIRHVFHQFLDIQISDEDILEYIEECDLNNDGVLDKNEFCLKFLINYFLSILNAFFFRLGYM